MSPLIVPSGVGTGSFDALVDTLLAEFDTDSATAARIANARHRQLVQRTKWRAADMDFGPTVAGTARYALPNDLTDVEDLEVGGVPYARTTHQLLGQLQDGSADLGGAVGAFAEYADDNGARFVELYPTPDSIETIAVWGALSAATRTYGAGETLLVPEDFHGYLLAGCRADAYRQVDDRPDMAPPEEQLFEQGVSELRALRVRLFSGTTRAPISGYDFR